MPSRRLIALLAVAVSGLAAATGSVQAATAIASDPISIFAGPNTYNPILGRLLAGEQVTIDRCTVTGNWCRVFHNGPTGWVPASYLVGAAAKLDATPLRSLTDPPFDQQRDLGRTHHDF